MTSGSLKGCVKAMQAAFDLCEAINENDLTINDLIQICRLAIDDGHDSLQMNMEMMSIAISVAAPVSEQMMADYREKFSSDSNVTAEDFRNARLANAIDKADESVVRYWHNENANESATG